LGFRLTSFEPSELDLHAACAQALDKLVAPPALWASYPAGHVQLQPHEAARLARTGLKRGFPDIMVFFGRVFGIELKRGSAKLSKTRIVRTRRGGSRELIGQEDMFPLLLATGAWADIRVARSLNEVFDHLADWQIPLRGRISI
jgi:hypothetical protein